MGLIPKTLKFESGDTGIWASAGSGIIYEFSPDTGSRTKPLVRSYGGKKVLMWGRDNLLPYHNRTLLDRSDIRQQLINANVALTAGQELAPYMRVDNDGDGARDTKWVDDKQIQRLIDDLYLNEVYTDTLQDLRENGNSWTEAILNNGRLKVTGTQSLDACECRLAEPIIKGGRVDTLLYADWKATHLAAGDIEEIPLLDSKRPIFTRHSGPLKLAIHVKKHYSGNPHYTHVEWGGTKIWEKIAQKIKEYHLSGLDNNYGWRLHVQVPWSYLQQRKEQLRTAEENSTLTDEQLTIKVKSEIQSLIDQASAGTRNNGKPLYTWIMDNLPNPTEWKVTPIKTDQGDDSYLKLLEIADKKAMNGHGLHPVLGGLQTTGNLGSGSEIMHLTNYHVKFMTPEIRRIALRPIEAILKFNLPDKWRDGRRIGVLDKEMTTQDTSRSGIVTGGIAA